tara:strand:- start:25 stop:258 length:234 start_codon:yes stop_codon:yes gene_type:complete
MSNNLPQDMYDPPSSNAIDFEEYRFSDIPLDELFWLNKNPNSNENTAHRKHSDTEGMNTKTRLVSSFERSLKVYQKI